MPADHIILVPGFLGFQRLWDLPYFSHTEDLLARPFTSRGRRVEVQAIRTLPTSSLGQRAARLAEVVAALPSDARVHLVGHSTGGLDARLLLAPGASLPTEVDVESAARKVRSVVSVATPHYGTPLASYMTGVQGHRLLRVASIILTRLMSSGRRSMRGVGELSKAVLMLDALAGIDRTIARGLISQIDPTLDALADTATDSVHALLEDMGDDTALLEQLTPASLELFNNATGNRRDVRYGSVVAMAPRPSVRRRLRVGVDAYGQASYAVFAILHRLSAAVPARRLPAMTHDQRRLLQQQLGRLPDDDDSDGFVPTLSQVWGTVVCASECDHLDLMGYFGRKPLGHSIDLLSCGARFDSRDFENVWTAVARFGFESGA